MFKNLCFQIGIDRIGYSDRSILDGFDNANDDEQDVKEIAAISDKKHESADEKETKKALENGEYACDECDGGYKSKSVRNVVAHFLYRHSVDAGHRCQYCDKRLYSRKSLAAHQMSIHQVHLQIDNGSDIIMMKKGRQTISEQKQPAAIKEDRMKLDLQKCTECDKMFANKGLLNKHRVYHMVKEEMKYECRSCMKKYPKNWLLNRHLKVSRHNGGNAHNVIVI